MINLKNIRDYVVIPALTKIGHAEPAAIRLVIGTGLIESNYEYLAQQGGPALGLWQMEPVTHNDLYNRFLGERPVLKSLVDELLVPNIGPLDQLSWNLQYAAVMCRVKYLSIPDNLPSVDDLEGISSYYKKWYNTPLGSATADKFMQLANQYELMSL